MNRLIAVGALAILALFGSSQASAQDPADQDIKLFRKDLRSLRKQIIAANVDLSDKEAEQFSPLFDRYTQELIARQGRKIRTPERLRPELHRNDRCPQAEDYVRGRAGIDEAITARSDASSVPPQSRRLEKRLPPQSLRNANGRSSIDPQAGEDRRDERASTARDRANALHRRDGKRQRVERHLASDGSPVYSKITT